MNISLKTPGVHPRLAFDANRIQDLRRRLEQDAGLQQAFAHWCGDPQDLLNQEFMTEETANSVYSQHGRFYEIGAQISELAEKLGLLYQLTGDSRYAEKLRQAMLYYGGFACWTGPLNAHRDTPWTSDLSTTRILWGFALAYDCIFDSLQEADRTFIRDAMVRCGVRPLLNDWVLPGTRVHALDSMGHNWWSVCISLALAGLCAVWEAVPQAEEWMEQGLKALHGFCTFSGSLLLNKVPNFDDKGLFYESPNYFNYGVGELLRFRFLFTRLFENGAALTDFAHMEQVPQAFFSMSYPTGDPEKPLLFPDFGDSRLDGSFVLLPQMMLLCGWDLPELHYAYRCFQKSPDFWDFLYPDQLALQEGSLKNLPLNQVFDQSGYAYLRTSWENDATLLAVRCGYTWNHAHNDSGHFIWMADGGPVICDAGTCSYDRPEYDRYYKSWQAHNIVTINGHAQREDAIIRGSKFPGAVSHFVDGPMKYLLSDATGPTCDSCSRNYRSFLWLCPDILVVIDDLRAHMPSEFAAQIHCTGPARVTENGIRAEGRTPLGVTVLYPDRVKIETRPGFLPPSVVKGLDPNSPEVLPEKDYYVFQAPGAEEIMQFVTFCGIHEAADLTPERLSGPGWIGLKVRFQGDTYRIAYNLLSDGRKMHENSSNQLFGFDTDAYILAVKTDARGAETALMCYGSYLRRQNISYFESFTKEFQTIPL